MMTNDEFEMRLKDMKLTKKEFAKIVNMSYGGVVNWGREQQTVPSWVESWIDLYSENLKFKTLKQSIKESGACK